MYANLDTPIDIHKYGVCQSAIHVKYIIYDIYDIHGMWHMTCIHMSLWVSGEALGPRECSQPSCVFCRINFSGFPLCVWGGWPQLGLAGGVRDFFLVSQSIRVGPLHNAYSQHEGVNYMECEYKISCRHNLNVHILKKHKSLFFSVVNVSIKLIPKEH